AANLDVEPNASAEDVIAEESVRVRLGDRARETFGADRVFAANVEKAALAAGREPGDRHRLDDRERIAVEQHAILERPRLGFVGVADEIVRTRRLLRDRFPFASGRERRAAATHKLRIEHLADHGVRADLKRAAKGLESAG